MPIGNGGIIGSANVPTITTASGVWSLREQQQAQGRGAWPLAIPPDPYFEYTTLLLPGNGTDGQNNNAFLDGSTNNFTITRNGNTTQGTFSPFSQTGWGNYFDGTSDYLNISGNPANTLSTGTFEFWVYLSSISSVPIFAKQRDGTGTWGAVSIGSYANSVGIWSTGTPGKIYFHSANGVTEAASTNTISANTWVHVAIVFSASNCKFYINGTLDSTVSGNYSIPTDNSPTWTRISSQPGGTTSVNGYISNFRFSNIARTISLPTSPYTSDANTLLLTCQSNRFIDNSSNNFTITPNGSTSVVAFSPFNPTLPWSAATNGGSGYFDGNGDFLSIASNTALDVTQGNFTFECWIYRTVSASQEIWNQRINSPSVIGLFLRLNSNNTILFSYAGTASSITSTSTIPLNSWTHLAVTRSSSTVSIFINGNLDATASFANGTYAATNLLIGRDETSASQYTGYLSNWRLIKGVAVYTGSFTPPTAPITNAGSTSAASYPSTTNVNTSFASSATSLLLNFTNAGITDATAKNDLETVGSAQISNTTAQFGGTSIKFNGTTDYLVFPSTGDSRFDFGTGDFTVECWIYLNSIPSNNYRQILSFGTTSSSQRWLLLFDTRTVTSSPYLAFYSLNSSNAVTTEVKGGGASGWSSGVWYYVAVTRSGNDFKLFRDGSQNGATVTDADPVPGTSSTGRMYIGSEVGGSLAFWDGYIQDVRITRGYARPITAKPTAAFPTL